MPRSISQPGRYHSGSILPWLHAPEDPAYDLVIDAAVGEIAYAQIASALAQWRSPR